MEITEMRLRYWKLEALSYLFVCGEICFCVLLCMPEKFLQNVRKCEGKRPHWSKVHMLEDNIKIFLKQVGCADVDCMQLAQDGV
jgi:hypothetical protein